jgi:GTPase SAR1 family protein
MGFKTVLKKPLVVGGIGLSALLGLWSTTHSAEQPWGQWSLWILSGLGLLIWRWQRRRQTSPEQRQTLTPEILQTAVAHGEKLLARRQAQAPALVLEDLAQELQTLRQSPIQPGALNGIVLGEKRSGKTSLLNLLPSQLALGEGEKPLILNWQVVAAETPPETMAQSMTEAHWVLVLTTGDLTSAQWQVLEFLQAHHHHWQLLFNKQDIYPIGDRQTLWDQLQHQVNQLGNPNPVIPISAAPQPIQIRRYLADGQWETDQEIPPPDLGNLVSQLQQQATEQWESLVLGQQWRRCRGIGQQVEQRWQENRRTLALPLVEQAQWLAAGTALVNPVANLDLLAAIAINGQLVWDLGELYHQKISLSQAQTVAKEMGAILIKLGMVELSTQALGALLKSQPLTYLAGGALQGLSAAYLTRIAGLSLITFLESQNPDLSEPQWDWQKLTAVVKQTFEQNQRRAVLQGFFHHARQQLSPASSTIA